MTKEEIHRASHWILRSMEWDDSRARYPNIWQDGMPRNVLATDRAAHRLRLGDLIATYYPSSTRHPERSDRYIGISRVVGLRQADQAGMAWIDLETAHRFREPLNLGSLPGRVFLCCDPGWPERDVALFRAIADAAVAQGWRPKRRELPPLDQPLRPAEELQAPLVERKRSEEPAPAPAPLPVAPWASESDRLFAGAEFSGDMRDPRTGTWLAVVAMSGPGEELRVIRLEATGSSGLQALLRNPPRDLMQAEAIGMGFPFGLPADFAEALMGGPFPDEGWWALAKRLEKVTWPDYLVALQEFRDERGEIPRLADERAGTASPLRRVEPDMGSRFYHGIRMIAEDRSRFAIRPFESAQGKLLIEVSPGAATRQWNLPEELRGAARRERLAELLEGLPRWPVKLEQRFRDTCRSSQDALDAVVAARCAAVAVMTEETGKTPAELAEDGAERVRHEGWVYGLQEG
jgi:hypothetical protein